MSPEGGTFLPLRLTLHQELCSREENVTTRNHALRFSLINSSTARHDQGNGWHLLSHTNCRHRSTDLKIQGHSVKSMEPKAFLWHPWRFFQPLDPLLGLSKIVPGFICEPGRHQCGCNSQESWLVYFPPTTGVFLCQCFLVSITRLWTCGRQSPLLLPRSAISD